MTAFLDQLAADAAEAADVHGPASREHDAAMDAFAEAEEEADQQIGRDAATQQAFYGWHAEYGHAARWGPDGPECDSCFEQYRPPAQPEREAEAG